MYDVSLQDNRIILVGGAFEKHFECWTFDELSRNFEIIESNFSLTNWEQYPDSFIL